jgi:PAS domain S-box-containing protein
MGCVVLKNFWMSSRGDIGRIALLAGLVFTGFSAVAIYVSDSIARENAIADIRSVLTLKNTKRVERFSGRVYALRREVVFLAKTPPIQGIIRAVEQQGFDREGNSTDEIWKARLANIFAAYMESHPEVYQARYIGVAGDGRELVRVELRGGHAYTVPEDALQNKGSRDYFKAAIRLADGEVLLSDIDLNRERGKIERPHRPTLRVATPVRDANGQPFGIVILNANLSDLQELSESLNHQRYSYVLNSTGDFLAHPDPDKTYGFDLGTRHRWQDEFIAPEAGFLQSGMYESTAGQRLAEFQSFSLDETDSSRKLYFVETAAEAVIDEAVARSRSVVLLVLAGVGGIGGIGIYLLSLSLQRREESHLKNAELAAIVDSSNDAIIGTTLDDVVTSWNAAAEGMFGYSAREALGQTLTELMLLPEQVEEEGIILAQIRRGEVVPPFETVRRCKDGGRIDVSVTVSPVTGSDGWVVGTAKIVRDISAEKAIRDKIHDLNQSLEQQIAQRTSALKKALALQAAILERAGYAIYYGNAKGIIEIFNPAAEALLGYSAEEVVGKLTPLHFLDPDEFRNRFGRELDDLKGYAEGDAETSLLDKDAAEAEWTYIAKDGRRIPTLVRYSSLQNEAGEPIGHLAIIVDLSDRKRREQELIEAREKAEAGSKAKSEFLANMSHEIRTPMNAVLGMMSLLERSELKPAQLDYVKKAGVAATTLLEIINDILDFSKIEANKLVLDPQPFDIERLLRDIAVILEMNLGDKPVELLFQIDPTLPRMLVGDSVRIKQVLINLAGNAIKFTNKGEVTIIVKIVDAFDDSVSVDFHIRDTGIGMSEEQQNRVFHSFTQAEAGTARRFGGTGLGLVISQSLIRAMGGEVHMESELGKGSCFWFTLNFKIAESAGVGQLIQLPPTQLRNLRVLIVDDNEHARQISSNIAHSLSWQPVQAASGREALNLVKSSLRVNKPFDIAIIDWAMPDLDGWNTAQEIRVLLHDTTKLALLMMVTAPHRSALLSNIKAYPQVVDGFLMKPVTPSDLLDAVANCLSSKPRKASMTPLTAAGSVASTERVLSGLRILLVDDNATNLEVARSLLVLEGADVTEASGGGEAIELLRRAPEAFDVVLMDVQMPDIDGYESTRRIRTELGLTELPVIAMTANAMPSDRQASLEAGMNDHIGKPFDLELLVAMLVRHTGHVAPAILPRPAPEPGADLPHVAGFDFHAALYRMGNNRDLLLTQLAAFGEKNVNAVQAVRDYLAEEDKESAGRALHTLRGIAATLGADHLAAVVNELEDAIKEGVDSGGLAPVLDQVDLALQKTLKVFGEIAVAQGVGQAHDTQTEPDETGSELSTEKLDELEGLLRESNMKALTLFGEIQPFLPHNESSQRLAEAVRNLQFSEALGQLNALRG